MNGSKANIDLGWLEEVSFDLGYKKIKFKEKSWFDKERFRSLKKSKQLFANDLKFRRKNRFEIGRKNWKSVLIPVFSWQHNSWKKCLKIDLIDHQRSDHFQHIVRERIFLSKNHSRTIRKKVENMLIFILQNEFSKKMFKKYSIRSRFD